MKIEYRTVKFLRSQPGFGWDDRNCLVTAAPQDWDKIIAVRNTRFRTSYYLELIGVCLITGPQRDSAMAQEAVPSIREVSTPH